MYRTVRYFTWSIPDNDIRYCPVLYLNWLVLDYTVFVSDLPCILHDNTKTILFRTMYLQLISESTAVVSTFYIMYTESFILDLFTTNRNINLSHRTYSIHSNTWASYQIPKISGCTMPGTFFPPSKVSDPEMHHGACVTHVPWCMPGSLTSGFFWRRWRGKRSRYSWRMRNPQFYVSGWRPIDSTMYSAWQSSYKETHLRLSAGGICRYYTPWSVLLRKVTQVWLNHHWIPTVILAKPVKCHILADTLGNVVPCTLNRLLHIVLFSHNIHGVK